VTPHRTIECALVTVPYDGWYLRQLEEALAPAEVVKLSRDDRAGVSAALQRADVAIIDGGIDDRFLHAPRLRWVHADASGIESSAWPELFDREIVVTGSAGRAGPVMAEHAFFFLLALVYDAHGLQAAQAAHRWRGIPGYEDRRGLVGKTLGLIGFGFTGQEVATRARAFGMRVVAYRRSAGETPPTVDRVYVADRGEGLEGLLGESDFVVLAIRLSNETYHLIGERELRQMKRSAYLVNLARGAVVDEVALVAALRDHVIAGAGFDTFGEEPLPPDSPIWDAPNMIVTPHVTPDMPDTLARSVDIIVRNIDRYRRGEPLLNGLERRDAYTRNRQSQGLSWR
jgi:phosphoglycerate dehydrogenase-like enzyme